MELEHTISVIFHKNIELIQNASKATFYFYRQQYGQALENILETIDNITIVVEQILEAGDYFGQEICADIGTMLTDFLNAKKNMDFVLLADLLKQSMIPLIMTTQEVILEREDNVSYSKERYDSNLRTIYALMAESGADAQKLEEFSQMLLEPLNTRKLIEAGYRIEVTSCGVMTAVVNNCNNTFYLHSNHSPLYEAFLLADSWYQEDVEHYVIYGVAVGYHIQELCKLTGRTTKITVYESDINLLKLSCAFTSYLWVKEYPELKIIYDPELIEFRKTAHEQEEKKKVLIHYPSFRNIREHAVKTELSEFIPLGLKLENS